MAKIYYRKIKAGTMTIDEVPTKWRAEVEAMLEADEPKVEPEVEPTPVEPEVVDETIVQEAVDKLLTPISVNETTN